MKKSFRRLDTLRLEDRLTPAAQYVPPSYFLSDPAEFTTKPSDQPAAVIAREFLAANAAKLGATAADIATAEVTDNYSDADTGVSYVYFGQTHQGLRVTRATLNVTVAADGRVIAAGGGFVPGLADQVVSPIPTTTAHQAMMWTEAMLDNGEPMPGCNCVLCAQLITPSTEKNTVPTQVYQATANVAQEQLIATKYSLDPVPARLEYVPNEAGSVDLTWALTVRTTDGDNWYNLHVTQDGIIAAISNWVDEAGYNTVPLPNESPNDGGFAVLADPWLTSASPFGWHDTNGVAGPEFTDTRGNNVIAHLDRDANNVADTSPPRPAGGTSLNFSTYGYDITQVPTILQNQNAAVTNLFVLNNIMHDVMYQYGFTPSAGNFQTNTYGLGGSGNDAVQADAQDGSGTGNANFGTPPDGSAPRMQMFLWTNATPDRDSDMDNGVIIHEYGHGISNRLTGGPANADALDNIQSGGMGEGWSDFFALMLMQRPTDTQNGGYGIGTYLLDQSQTGLGIRQFRYSYDMAVNPMMWDSYGSSGTGSNSVSRSTAVHRTGTMWCTTLWDMNWLLINKYGYDSDMTTGYAPGGGAASAGNKLALRLVMDAMKIQPANPSFVQARDAILAADTALTGGANHLQIWQAFSRRGLGEGAVDTGSGTTTSLVNDTVIPASVQTLQVTTHTPDDLAVLSTAPTTFTLNLTDALDASTISASDFKVNGIDATSFSYTAGATSISFSFATSPVTVNGLQTMTIVADAFSRASDSTGVQAFNASFRYDPVAMVVSSTTPANGANQAPPLTTFDVNLNEAVLPASVSVNDLRLSQGYATAFTLLNSNTTVRFTVTGLSTESALTATLPAGAFTDANGNTSAAFSGTYQLDYTTRVMPAATAVNPVGSRISRSTETGLVNTTTDADDFTLTLAAGDVITTTITPSGGLRPRITILSPSNTVVTTATASATGSVVSVTVVASVGGTYTLRVDSTSSTTGTYTIDALRNATQELEAIGGATNHTNATAQTLVAQSETTTLRTGTRTAVLGTTDVSTTYTASTVAYAFEDISTTGTTVLANADDATANISLPFTFNFFNTNYTSLFVSDNGLITFGSATTSNSNGSLTSSPSQAAIASLWDDLEMGSAGVKWQVLGTAGSRRLVIQWQNGRYWTSGNTGTFALQFQVVLTEGTNTIRFNYANLDGNVTSSNGGRLASIGIKDSNTNGATRLLLSQNNTSIYHGNGVSTLISPPAPTKDFYAITAEANDTLTLALSALTTGTPTLELFAPDGTTLLGTAITGATNYTTGLANVVVPSAGTYFLAVGGTSGVNYSLNAVLGSFDTEANNTAATAKAMADDAFGALTSGDTDWYSFTQPADSRVAKFETSTPGSLNPKLDLFAADGTTLIASGVALADTRNESLTATGLTPGASYRLRLSAEGGTTGDYLVNRVHPPAPAVDNVEVNDGAIQRSRVTRLDVTFNRAVTLSPGAFQVSNGTTTYTSQPGGGLLTVANVVGETTVVTITFSTTAAGIEFGSLADGVWTLSVAAAGVTAADGQTMLAAYTSSAIKRLFGDFNGDATVDGGSDFVAFAFATVDNSPFDFNDDGVIDGPTDFAEFGLRFGKTI